MPELSEGIIFSKILTERSEVNIFKNNTNEMSVIFVFNARACECIKYKHPWQGTPNNAWCTEEAVRLHLL